MVAAGCRRQNDPSAVRERARTGWRCALTTVPERAWFEIDECYVEEMAERRRLLAERHEEVFGALPESDPARNETLRDACGQSDDPCRPSGSRATATPAQPAYR